VKVSVAAAYSQTNSTSGNSGNVIQLPDTGYFQIGAYAEHIPTGLFVYGAYGHLDYQNNNFYGDTSASNTYYIKGGIRQRWNPLGHTVLYGEYERAENNLGATINALGPDGLPIGTFGTADETSVRMWGLGVVQEIDAAAMSVWLKYRNLDASTDGVIDADNFNEVTFGALINF
jgi:hypothetical protein